MLSVTFFDLVDSVDNVACVRVVVGVLVPGVPQISAVLVHCTGAFQSKDTTGAESGL